MFVMGYVGTCVRGTTFRSPGALFARGSDVFTDRNAHLFANQLHALLGQRIAILATDEVGRCVAANESTVSVTRYRVHIGSL